MSWTKIMECVPNFSEGRDLQKIDEIVSPFRAKAGVKLLDYSNDEDHNRLVVTVVGEPDALKEAVIEAIGIAVELIDLNHHQGQHPRMGAVDVVPFIPIKGCTMEDAIAVSKEVGQRVASQYNLPVFLYEKSATGQLGGIEKLDSGWTVAITYYNGFRILIPMDEMMINLSGDGREHSDTLNRQTRIANNMLGSDIDFIIRDLDEQSRSVVASRKDAMLKKRQMFYFNEDEEEKPMLYPGRIVEARVIAVAPKVVRLEVFGVEVSVRARDMAWEWMVDASEKFQVGDLTLVMVNQINIRSVEEMEISVDAKSATANVNKDNLKRCVRQGKYVGIITDVYKGTYFIRLNIGVNAVAHSCNMASLPSKRDEVGFVVTRINDKFEVAEGIITRMIKRGA